MSLYKFVSSYVTKTRTHGHTRTHTHTPTHKHTHVVFPFLKDGGLRLIIDLRLLNRAIKRFWFKMLTIKQIMSQITSEDWFVTIDLKDAYFHVSILPQHRKFLRFTFGGKAYQYRVLHFHEGCGCCLGSVATPGHSHTELILRLR